MAKIFMSHRASDAAVALIVQEQISSYCAKTIYCSSDGHSVIGGKEWRSQLELALKEAEWLVLLYSGGNQRWDWCMYEVGYFIGTLTNVAASRAGHHQRVAVVHPLGKVPPGPLNDIQSYPADAGRIGRMLSDICEEEESRLAPDRREDRDLAAARIVEAVTRLGGYSIGALPTFQCKLSLEYQDRNWVHSDSPDNVVVTVENRPHGLLKGAYTWSEFIKICLSFPQAQILQLVKSLLNREYPDFSIDAYDVDGETFRPVIIDAEVAELDASGLNRCCTMTIGIARAPRHMIASNSNKMSRSVALIELCLKFRTSIVERYIDEIQSYLSNDSDFDSGAVEARKLVGRIVFDLNEFRSVAMFLGFRNQQDVLDVISPDDRQKVGWIEDINNFAIYRNSIEDVLRDTSDATGRKLIRKVLEDFQAIREINLSFLRAASGSLAGIASSLRVPPISPKECN